MGSLPLLCDHIKKWRNSPLLIEVHKTVADRFVVDPDIRKFGGMPQSITPFPDHDHFMGDETVAKASLTSLGIDLFGLDDMDRAILTAIIDKFNGGPVGVNSLSVAVSEDSATIEDVYEPYLIKEGFIQRTNRGRIAQKLAYKLLGRTITEKQQRLFE